MKIFKLLFGMFFFFFLTTNTFSQGSFSTNLGVLIPVSDYASDDIYDEDSGGAGTGLGLGLQYLYPITQNGLNLFCGVDLFYNGLKKSVKNDIEDMYNSLLGISNGEYNFFKMINVPISAGLNYTFKSNEKLSVFGNAGITYNFYKITDFVIKAFNETITVESDLSQQFGFKIGGGLLFNDKTSFTINYLGLGKHDLNVSVSGGGMTEKIDSHQKVDMVTITLGIKF